MRRYCYRVVTGLVLALVVQGSAWAVIETYQFDSELQRERYQDFIEELRCPKCQNQNLAGSNSPISADLRRELHRLLREGKSDQEIVDYMVARYGDFVLYRPPLNQHTLILWLLPIVLLGVAALVVIMLLRRRSAPQQLDEQELHRRAQDLLARYEEEQK